jgi:hypothetical protein
MDHDDSGGGGWFAYYPTTGDAIRTAADDVHGPASELGGVRRQLEGEHRRALAAVDGQLYAPLTRAPEMATANLIRVEQAANFAAGVVRLFADAVDDYNHYATNPRSVQALNAAYTDARLNNFGLDPDADDTDRATARAGVLRDLTAEYHRLGGWLDLRAEQAARMLDRGPNPGDVTALWAAGAMPPDAHEIWPDLNLVETPLPRLPYELRADPGDRRTLQELSQDELIALWEDHEFEPARDRVAEWVVGEYEHPTALREFNLSINVAYMTAMAEGIPESFARRLATLDPTTIFDLLAPIATVGELGYRATVGDLVDTLRHEPWSLRTLGELAMVTPVGRLGKLRKIDNLVDAADNTRDVERLHGPATSVAHGARLRAQLAANEIADGHAFHKHIDEFDDLGITNQRQFANHIEEVINHPSEVRGLSRSRTAFWDADTGTVVIRNPNAADGGTAFLPKDGKNYFDKLGQ